MFVLPAPARAVESDDRQAQEETSMSDIAEAILAHAEALRELAQAIREHTYAVAPQDEDEDEAPTCYMDGTPVQ